MAMRHSVLALAGLVLVSACGARGDDDVSPAATSRGASDESAPSAPPLDAMKDLGTPGDLGLGPQQRHLSAASQELLRLTINRSPSAPPMSLDRVKQLVAEGADLSARNSGGAYPFVLAVETHAYLVAGGQTAKADAAKQVAEYLMAQGSDISSVDGRGFSPLMYLLFYNPDLSLATEIVAHNPDFSTPTRQGRTPLHVFAARSAPQLLETVLANATQLHANPMAADANGITAIMVAAAIGTRDVARALVLQRYLELIPPVFRNLYADLPDQSGMSPLMVAIQHRRAAVIDYLLSNFQLDVNRQDEDEETPLSLAQANADLALVARLEALGARPTPPVDPGEIRCNGANRGTMDFARFSKLLQVCARTIHAVDDVLPLLPSSLRAHYALMYATQGLASSDAEHPRAILYGKDGRFTVAFGDAHRPGNDTLEFYAFNDHDKQFEFYEVTFPDKQISAPNPPQCAGCHGAPAKPIWNTWSLWPGAYFGEMENLYAGAGEQADFDRFTISTLRDPSSRYRNLLPVSASPVRSASGVIGIDIASPALAHNIPLDFLVASLQGERISAELAASPQLRPFRYAILGALSCTDPVESFVPASVQATLPKTAATVAQEVEALGVQEAERRFTRQRTVRPGPLVGRYNVEAADPALQPFTGIFGFDDDPTRAIALRYLVEGVLGDGATASWYSPFNDNQPSYVSPDHSDIEIHAWQDLLDPAADADLIALYSSATAAISVGQVTSWIFDLQLPVQTQICPLLHQKSLAALGS